MYLSNTTQPNNSGNNVFHNLLENGNEYIEKLFVCD